MAKNASYAEIPGSNFPSVDPDEQQRVYEKLWADRYGTPAHDQFTEEYASSLQGAGLNPGEHQQVLEKLGARTKQTSVGAPMLGFAIPEEAVTGARAEHEADQTRLAEREADEPAPATRQSVAEGGIEATINNILPNAHNASIAAERENAARHGMTINEFRAWRENNLAGRGVNVKKKEDGTYEADNVDLNKLTPSQQRQADKPDLVMPEVVIEGDPAGAEAEATAAANAQGGTPGAGTAGTGARGAGGGGPYVRPAGWSRSQLPFRDETLKADAEADAAGLRTQENSLLHDAMSATVEKDIIESAREGAERRMAERATNEANRQAKIREQQEKRDGLFENLKSAEMDKRSYLERNPASGIALAIGAAIGGALAARTGGQNQGLATLENAINRDIQLQKMDIDKKRGDIEQMDSILARNRQILGDERAAEKAAELDAMKLVDMRLQEHAQATKSIAMRDNIDMVRAEWQRRIADKQMRFDAMMHHGVQVIGGTSAGLGSKEMKDMNSRYVPEFGGLARSEEEARKLRLEGSQWGMVKESMLGAIPHAQKIGVLDKAAKKVGWTTNEMAAMEQYVDNALQPYVALAGGGAAAEGEKKTAKTVFLADLNMGVPPEQAIRRALGVLESGRDRARRMYGITPAVDGVVIDPVTGRNVPLTALTGAQPAAPAPATPRSFQQKSPVPTKTVAKK